MAEILFIKNQMNTDSKHHEHTHIQKNEREWKKKKMKTRRQLCRKFAIDFYLHFGMFIYFVFGSLFACLFHWVVRSFVVGVWRGWQNPLMNLLCWFVCCFCCTHTQTEPVCPCPANISVQSHLTTATTTTAVAAATTMWFAVNAPTAIRLHW